VRWVAASEHRDGDYMGKDYTPPHARVPDKSLSKSITFAVARQDFSAADSTDPAHRNRGTARIPQPARLELEKLLSERRKTPDQFEIRLPSSSA
jgi:hypothetical protein